MPPSPRAQHQTIVLRAAKALDDFVTSRKLGRVFTSPLDVAFAPRRVVQPDVCFVSRANLKIVQDWIRGAPDLVVEVISEGTWRKDRVEKKALYEEYGVREYWIIDPKAGTIEVFELEEGSYKLSCKTIGNEAAHSKLLPGFSLVFNALLV